jgi:GNAT superfamily N-acetyltransferase
VFEAPFGPPAVVGRGGLELELEVGERSGFGRPLAITARRGGEVVGSATGWTDGQEARLVSVEAHVRGEGIGRQLVASFASAAADRGATVLVAAVSDPFLDALGFVDGRRAL